MAKKSNPRGTASPDPRLQRLAEEVADLKIQVRAGGESLATRFAAGTAIVLGLLSLPGSIEDLTGRLWAAPDLKLLPGPTLTLETNPSGTVLLTFNVVIVNEGTDDGIVTSVDPYLLGPTGTRSASADMEMRCITPLGQAVVPPFGVARRVPITMRCDVAFGSPLRGRVLGAGKREVGLRVETTDGQDQAARFCLHLSPETVQETLNATEPVQLNLRYPECEEDVS